jgi:hypothetical protein
MDRLVLAWLSILLRFILPRPCRLGSLTDDAINMAKAAGAVKRLIAERHGADKVKAVGSSLAW